MRLLIVDDSLSSRIYIVALLKKLGLYESDIIQVENGSQALIQLKNDKNFDIIFMDWEMPMMSGIEVASVMKFRGIKIPIVIITGRNSNQDVDCLIRLGVYDYLLKPFTINFLVDKIKRATGIELS